MTPFFRRRWWPAIVAVVLALIALPALAQSFPPLSGRVVDAADLLSPEQEAQLTQLSAGIEQAAGRQFVVATVPSLEGREIEDYGYRLGRAWGIGQKGANNGIILLVAPNERKVRIEVGYGLEPIMTDALSSVIINQTILPRFKAGDMAGGIVAGADAIASQMKLPPEAAEQRAQQQVGQANQQRRRSGGGGDVGIAIFWIVVVMFVVFPMVAGRGRGRGRGRRYRSGIAPVVMWGPGLGGGSSWGGGGSSWGGGGSSWGGGGGGGGFSGGGGSFGGGGASGGW